jgi:enoyl-CoA hydratase/carnithine racemase
MNTVDYTPVPSLESLQKRVTALEAREVDLVERLRVANNLLAEAESIIRLSTRQGGLGLNAARRMASAYQRTKESGHG